jgi:hypothetical protein
MERGALTVLGPMVERKAKWVTPGGWLVVSSVIAKEIGKPKWSQKPKAMKFWTLKKEERRAQQTLLASRVALQALAGMWPAKAANNLAELQRAA